MTDTSAPGQTAVQRVRETLDNHGCAVHPQPNGRAIAQCPAHDDAHPSLSLAGIPGQALVYCHAGCATTDVMAALGLSLHDLYDSPRGVAYHYEDGRQVFRTWDPQSQTLKRFRQSGQTQRPDGAAALYRLSAVHQAVADGHPVYIVEGEKDVHALETLGVTATCSPMGAGKAAKADWTPLRGAHVVLVADRDQPGDNHARDVAQRLDGLAASVQTVRSAAGNDTADHIAAGHNIDEFQPVAATHEQPYRRVRSEPISRITRKRRKFLWDKRLPLGELTLWVGHAGIGKSQAAVWLAAQVSRGALPGELHGSPTPVLYLATEDDWEHELAPRFDAADADPEQVRRLFVETAEGSRGTVTLSVDIDTLRQEIYDSGTRLVVLDALLSTFGSDRLTEQGVVRRNLEPLSQLAQETGVAIIGVAHFRKASDANPLHMVSGSAEFGQVVRSAIGFAPDREADDGSCVMSLIKTNITPGGTASLRYRIDPALVDTFEGSTDAGRFVVLGETEQDVGALLNYEPASPEEQSERMEAVEWLRFYLTEGDRGGMAPAGDVIKAGEQAGFLKRTIQRARRKAGVTTQKHKEGWMWAYSPTDEQGDTPQQGDIGGNPVTSEDVKVTSDAPGVPPCHLDTFPGHRGDKVTLSSSVMSESEVGGETPNEPSKATASPPEPDGATIALDVVTRSGPPPADSYPCDRCSTTPSHLASGGQRLCDRCDVSDREMP